MEEIIYTCLCIKFVLTCKCKTGILVDFVDTSFVKLTWIAATSVVLWINSKSNQPLFHFILYKLTIIMPILPTARSAENFTLVLIKLFRGRELTSCSGKIQVLNNVTLHAEISCDRKVRYIYI